MVLEFEEMGKTRHERWRWAQIWAHRSKNIHYNSQTFQFFLGHPVRAGSICERSRARINRNKGGSGRIVPYLGSAWPYLLLSDSELQIIPLKSIKRSQLRRGEGWQGRGWQAWNQEEMRGSKGRLKRAERPGKDASLLKPKTRRGP